MSHTEQMREALRHAKRAIENWCDLFPGKKDALDTIAIEAIQAALTDPAAEVPEAVGDEPELPEAVDQLAQADGFNVISTVDVFTADQLRTYAKQYAQWQSTRLRGGVPEVLQAAQALVDMIVGELPTTGYLRDNDLTRAALDRLRKSLTAAPQAPALDAGVVRAPMTEDDLNAMMTKMGEELRGLRCWGWLDLVRAVEAHHGITAAQAGGAA